MFLFSRSVPLPPLLILYLLTQNTNKQKTKQKLEINEQTDKHFKRSDFVCFLVSK